MTTRHVMRAERRDVTTSPSTKTIKRKIKSAQTMGDFEMKPGYLYTVVRAISARVNQNYDGWPSDELKKAAHTFVGKPVFVNHENYDPKKARGVVVASRYVENGLDKYIEVIQEIDARRFPKLAHEIRTGGLDSVSMGAEAGFTICSYCGNKAQDVPDMCDHVLFHKGEKLSRFNHKTGKREEVLVYESCHKLSFFELSYVFDPADETAVASKVLVASKTAGECAPGDPTCNSNIPDNSAPVSGMAGFGNPKSTGGSSGGASPSSAGVGQAVGGGELGKTPASGGTPSNSGGLKGPAVTLKNLYESEGAGSSVGGYSPNVDQPWDEHQTGYAVDLMNPKNPDSARQQAFDNGANYVLWQQKQWNPDGSTSPMEDRGSPTENHMDHMHINTDPGKRRGSFESQVLRTAGFKVADKCHYCAGDAEEGFKSCSAHRPMEEKKFTKAVVEAFRKGAPFAEYEDFDDCTSKNSDKGDADAYCGEIKHRTEDKKAMNQQTFEARVLQAAGMHSMPEHPGKHRADDERRPSEGFQVSDASDWLKDHPETFEARVKRAWGETEAPASVDTLREEGSAPEDDNNDFYHYVEPPKELQTPDLSQAAQIDREQDQQGMAGMDGAPGQFSPETEQGIGGGAPAGGPQQQYMELKIPIPSPGQAGAPGGSSIPMQPYQDQQPAPAAPPGPPQQIAASTLNYFDKYFGRRISRELNLQTLENTPAASTTSRNPMKGTANMARSTLASRGKAVTAGRRQHFAEGPLVDSGDQSRNDQGEQEEVFITQTPPAETVSAPTDDTPNISNTENNLVARVQQGRAQLMRDAQALAAYRQRTAGDQDQAGGPVATEVDPTVNTGPAAEELTGDDFESANPNDGVVETQPKDASLHAFKNFDRWLASKTGKPSRMHASSTIRRAADDYSRAAGISVQAMFPALGIVLREARKNEKVATSKGANMRKRADEKLEVAAPDDRINVESPVKDTTDADAQASQFDINDFGNNAGDNIADPDLSTDQNWAPGEAKTGKTKVAGGILAFRLAEAMISAGLEPNTAERKYALATEFENANRQMVQSNIALCERFANVLANSRRQVASGSTRGAALKAPVPTGLTQGAQRTAGRRIAANDPSNDSSLFV